MELIDGKATATAIKASYVPLDLKTGKFESCVTRCIKGILAVAGLDDDAHKGTDAGNHDKNAPVHAFKAPTFASAMEHKKERCHG